MTNEGAPSESELFNIRTLMSADVTITPEAALRAEDARLAATLPEYLMFLYVTLRDDSGTAPGPRAEIACTLATCMLTLGAERIYAYMKSSDEVTPRDRDYLI